MSFRPSTLEFERVSVKYTTGLNSIFQLVKAKILILTVKEWLPTPYFHSPFLDYTHYNLDSRQQCSRKSRQGIGLVEAIVKACEPFLMRQLHRPLLLGSMRTCLTSTNALVVLPRIRTWFVEFGKRASKNNIKFI